MDQRKSDPRIYIITLLFLSCIISGGVLLGLYLVLSDPSPLFLQAGMVFVGVPWLFWFLAYVYSCVLKPCSVSKSVSNYDPEKAMAKDVNNKIPEDVTSTTDPGSRNSPREGQKRVQFGDVVVLGDEKGGKEEDLNENNSNKLIQDNIRVGKEVGDDEIQGKHRSNSISDDETSVHKDCDRTPLRSSVGNKLSHS